jgi:hypothetical protein
MKSSSSLKSLLGGLVLLAAPAALAQDSTTSIPAFEAKMSAARATTSPSGATVTRQELVDALAAFGGVDTSERAYLATKVGDSTFLTGLTAAAKKQLTDFHELNDAAEFGAPLGMSAVAGTPAELFGASGALSHARIKEGYIPNGAGVANQVTLTDTYGAAFGSSYDNGYFFEPITPRELIAMLQSNTEGTPTADEVDGAVAYITQISRNSNRLYVSGWRTMGRGGPGEAAGFVVAAVSTDRRFVRMVEFLSWAE